MTIKQYIFLMTFSSVICWLAWIFLILNTDPYTANWLIFLFFYTSIFFGVVGAVAVVGLFFQINIIKSEEVIFRKVKKTLKQGIIFALFTVITIFLQQLRFLKWWNAILIFLLFILIEGIVISNRKYLNRDYV